MVRWVSALGTGRNRGDGSKWEGKSTVEKSYQKSNRSEKFTQWSGESELGAV